MNMSTFKMLTSEQQFWYANVMIDMVLADRHIHPSEQKYLGMIFKLFAHSPQEYSQLKVKSQNSLPSPIEPIEGISKEMAAIILQDCVDAAIADAEFHEKEQELIYEIGKCIGYPSREIAQIINKGKQLLGHIFAFAS